MFYIVQTVVKEPYESETLVCYNSLSEHEYTFSIQALATCRSYEDREVYFDFSGGPSGWLTGEQAIELGQLLIKHGTKALMANMINHQRLHHIHTLFKFIDEERVERLVMTNVDDSPCNYGNGFKTFLITPEWKVTNGKSMAPEYQEDFCFEQVIYWSPLDGEFDKQLKQWKVPIEFRNYNHDDTVREFKAFAALH